VRAWAVCRVSEGALVTSDLSAHFSANKKPIGSTLVLSIDFNQMGSFSDETHVSKFSIDHDLPVIFRSVWLWPATPRTSPLPRPDAELPVYTMSFLPGAFDTLFDQLAEEFCVEGEWETRQEPLPNSPAYLHVSRPSWNDENLNGIHLETYCHES
jgi:hypothetical protein